MSIHTIPCRIVAKKFGGIVPSASGSINLSFISAVRWRNFGHIRNFSHDTQFSMAKEFQALPIVQWFDQSTKASCSYAQNLIENLGSSGTPLDHLGLFTWWRPSSWYRVFLEFLHTNYELSWLATVICGTILIRIATLSLPALILWKKARFEKSRRSFLHRVQSRLGSVMLYSSSLGIFLTQYCCINEMAEVVYPGLTTGGMLSFTDLTVSDPSFLLPTLTAICFTFTSKKWIETLQMQKTVTNWLLGLKPDNAIYPIAACSFFVANNVPSIVCIYWITSSLISSAHATMLMSGAIRSFLHLPAVCPSPAEARRTELLNYVSEMRRKKANEALGAQNTVAEIEEKSQNDEMFKLLVKEADNIGFGTDSLFQECWREDTTLSSSKIAKLMEQRIREAGGAGTITKPRKLNSVSRAFRKMLPRSQQVMLQLRRHVLTELSSLPLVKMLPRQSLIANGCQIRHISFFRSDPQSPTVPEAAPANTPFVSTDATDFTLIEELQLGLVKDFHFLDFIGGNSLVKEYNLFSWWSPASWFRLALEYMHFNIDLPWWLTVVCATTSLRLIMIFVPIASHRLMGRVQLYKKDIDEFKEKMEIAQKGGNFLQTMEIQKELKDFLKAKDIKLYQQFILMCLNGVIFMTQFIAIKKLADAAFPGMSTGGLYWFKDLTVPDPHYLLPLISAVTVAVVFKMGAETGGASQGANPQIQKMLTRIGPVVVFACSTKVSSAIALYWCTSNMVSVMLSGIFRIPLVRGFLKIPQLPSKQVHSCGSAVGRSIDQRTMKKQVKKTSAERAKDAAEE
ncbi:unnamed protein product [Litomosoides sigmodontis]|uniref:Membrane insertase YidC/Oxa/ALB C-terminal domain-containing protein n=1 Tax=Litomosoides sigmodontis TaxID=42156 RepID=A0A3P6U8F3_LITSI|nr:unnamed protein product [Litomosoides sigmodontis]